MLNLRQTYWLLHYLGPRWAAFRLGYAGRKRFGILERGTPLSAWSDVDAPWAKDVAVIGDAAAYLDQRCGAVPRFLFDPGDAPSYRHHFEGWDAISVGPTDRVNALMQGRMLYFEQVEADTGFPPEWHRNPFTGTLFRLALLTAQRMGDVAALRWSDINDADVWTIPAEVFKGKRKHMVPLSRPALAALEHLEEFKSEISSSLRAPTRKPRT